MLVLSKKILVLGHSKMKVDEQGSQQVLSANVKKQSADKSSSINEQNLSAEVSKPSPVNSPASQVSLDSGKHCQARLAQIAQHFGLSRAKNPHDKKATTVEQRAERRHRLNKARKQQNLESIMDYALGYTDKSDVNDDVDPDWLYQFFELAESIFTPHMQAFWGKILAMQVTRPGCFSLKALKTLNQMTVTEANAFQKACALLCKDKTKERGDHGGRIISGFFRPASLFGLFGLPKATSINLSHFGLTYPNLLTLIDLNIIYVSEIETGPLPLAYNLVLECNGKKLDIKVRQQGAALQYYKLTQTGNELARLMKTGASVSYFEHLTHVLAPVFSVNLR